MLLSCCENTLRFHPVRMPFDGLEVGCKYGRHFIIFKDGGWSSHDLRPNSAPSESLLLAAIPKLKACERCAILGELENGLLQEVGANGVAIYVCPRLHVSLVHHSELERA